MVTWTNNDPRETYIANRWKPKKANVAPINPGWDDRRSAYLRKSFADNVNATRQHRATWENPDWILSQGPDFFTNRENLSKAKPILSQLKGNQDFWTTDQDESRNMYQMVMNNMRGGKGAQMLDMRGLPWAIQRDPNKYRRGRTLFTDPAKSQGFFKDIASIFTGKNPAAVRAPTWNPLHTTGYGKDFYAQEFPITNAIENVLDTGGIWGLITKNILPKRKRKVLPSDRSWIPEGLGEFNEMDYIPFMGDELDNEFNWFDAYAPFDAPFNAEQLRSEGKGGLFELEDNIIPIPEDSIERIISEDDQVEIDMDEASENIELTDDRKAELKALLLSPEFQALPWLEKLPILESYGYTEPDLLSGIN